MLSIEFTCEQDVLQYIEDNKQNLLDELEEQEIRNIYHNDNTRINIMKDGKRLIKGINRYEGNKKISDVFKDIADLKLF